MLTRFTLAGVAVLGAAALASSAASARTFTSYGFAATGIETGVPANDVSPFAGTAVGTGGVAVWNAHVQHACGDSLNPDDADITGGDFSLAGTQGVRLGGTFTGGHVLGFCAPQAQCANQSYTIDDATLVLTDALGNTLTGTFDGTLTHYSRKILGTCVTYFATISGRLAATPGP